MFTGFLAGIRARGLFDTVQKMVPEDTAQLMDSPPLAISWFETRHSREVLDAVETLRGLDDVRTLGAEALNNGIFQLFKPLLAGFVRTVGANPPALYAKMSSVWSPIVRGYEMSYREITPTLGEITLHSHNIADSRAGLTGGWENAFLMILDLAKSRDRQVRLQHFERRGEDTVSRFHAKWTAG